MSMPELLGARAELAPPLWPLVRDATEIWGKKGKVRKTRLTACLGHGARQGGGWS